MPTPVGNLEDITFRAVRVLKEAALVLAEDTRVSGRLMQHFDINTPMRSFHMHNEHAMAAEIATELSARAEDFALVSDAGTPGISDPAFSLVRACLAAGVEVSCLPGPTAFVPALVMSGLPTDRFVFRGFIPHKKGRQKLWTSLQQESLTGVFYESPHRLLKTLDEICMFLGEERRVAICREISKIYEECLRGTAGELRAEFKRRASVKGEFVIIVAGYDYSPEHAAPAGDTEE